MDPKDLARIMACDMAFPVQGTEQTPNATVQNGLTKREYFAALAAQGMLASETENFNFGHTSNIAERAVKVADALLAELAKL